VRAKDALIRVVRSSVNGVFIIDPHGKEKGRGTYVCPDAYCVNRGIERQRINKAFRVIRSSGDRIRLESLDRLRRDLLELIKVEYH